MAVLARLTGHLRVGPVHELHLPFTRGVVVQAVIAMVARVPLGRFCRPGLQAAFHHGVPLFAVAVVLSIPFRVG